MSKVLRLFQETLSHFPSQQCPGAVYLLFSSAYPLFHTISLTWLPARFWSETNPQSQILKMIAPEPNACSSRLTEYWLAKFTVYIS